MLLNEQDSALGGWIQSLFVPGGRYYHLYQGWNESVWLCILCGIVFCAVLDILPEKREINIIKLTILGLILFQLLFETRSKYLITYIPFFCILFSYGMILALQKVKLIIDMKSFHTD